MQIHALDARLLTRSGQVLQALTLWFEAHPTDRHPTVDQIAAASQIERRTVQRGLGELIRWGLVTTLADPSHPVRRSLEVIGLTSRPHDKSVTPDKPVVTDLSPQLRSKPTFEHHVERGHASFVTEHKDRPGGGTIADPLAKLMARHTQAIAAEVAAANQSPKLADLGHLEQQRRLPAMPARPNPSLKLAQAVALLDSGPPEVIEQAVGKLQETFGADFEPLYRKLCTAVQRGITPLAGLVEAIEIASRPKTTSPGKRFTWEAKRLMPRLFGAKPASESSYQDPSEAGRSAPNTHQSSLATG